MKAFKLFLLAICLAFPFSDVFAGSKDIDIHIYVPSTKPVKKLEGTIQTCVNKIGEGSYAVTFGNNYDDVSIDIYNDEGFLLGTVYAEYVKVGDTIVVSTTEDGAVELIVYSGDDEVYVAEL